MADWGWSTLAKKFNDLVNRKQRPRRSKSFNLRRRLSLELLEDRTVPSGFNSNQLINTALSPVDLAQSLVGTGVSVSNVKFTGGAASTGSFNFTDPTVVGFSQGILLSSGSAADVVGPNTSDWNSTDFALPGDPDLDKLSGFTTYDAAVLEFDFVPTANQVVFNYVFASDEYPEWVSTPYNDVFAFYVNGTNYAEVRQVAGDPASPFVPVAVNNINNSNPVIDPPPTPMRPDLFRANYYNPAGPSTHDLELDGITSVLTFQAPVNPGVVNHMKLAIADASDGIYDSAVFIQAGSLISNENPVADLSVTPAQGAAPLLVTAIVEGEDPNGAQLTYTINWGDGTPATDPVVLNEAALVDHTYTTPGTYIVTLTVSNGVLSGTSTEDVEVLSGTGNSAPVVTGNPVDQSVLEGDVFTLSASAFGVPSPTVQWQVSIDSGSTFNDIFGATDVVYSAVASLADNGNLYQAVFTNSEGTATTTTALLTVTPLDTTPPVAPDVTLAEDTGIDAADKFTQVGTLVLGNIEPDALVEYSVDGGSTWSDTFSAVEGVNAILVHQIDVAGNVSDSTTFNFTLDTTAPAAPEVTLTEDTGSGTTDLITQVGTLNLSKVETGAIVEYSIDGGTSWSDKFTAVEGVNTVLVRQTDVAGNVSDATTFSFTLDTTAAKLSPIFSTSQPILVGAAGITVSPNASDDYGIASQSSGQVITSSPGRFFVVCTATDVAGNSTFVSIPYIVGYKALNVLPKSGTSFKHNANIPVSFQLAEANGPISTQTALSLVPNVKVSLGGLPSVSVNYNKKTNTFSTTLKTTNLKAGVYDIFIKVTVGGIDVTTVVFQIKLL